MGPDDIDDTVELHGPIDPTRARCGVCDAIGIAFVADVRYFPGDGFVIGRPLLLCSRCRTLIATGNRFVLTTVISPELADLGRDRVATYLLHRVARVIPAVAAPPELAALRAQGFDLLGAHTGAAEELAAVWPPEHLRSLVDPYRDAADEPVWLVRSPWPGLAVTDVLELLWAWVERGSPRDPAARPQRLAQVFSWDEPRAMAWLDLCRNP